mmetsp:Transcript_19833/g.57531  ORF Transcript_19833/g.57531 Transcript_19833/m.57531 type:complete len:256 (-) Transcript_19833:486-1253(-)
MRKHLKGFTASPRGDEGAAFPLGSGPVSSQLGPIQCQLGMLGLNLGIVPSVLCRLNPLINSFHKLETFLFRYPPATYPFGVCLFSTIVLSHFLPLPSPSSPRATNPLIVTQIKGRQKSGLDQIIRRRRGSNYNRIIGLTSPAKTTELNRPRFRSRRERALSARASAVGSLPPSWRPISAATPLARALSIILLGGLIRRLTLDHVGGGSILFFPKAPLAPAGSTPEDSVTNSDDGGPPNPSSLRTSNRVSATSTGK